MASSTFRPQLIVQASTRRTMPPRIPQASHRHATPSGPWPWSDLLDSDRAYSDDTLCGYSIASYADKDEPWAHYPQSQFPNWTPYQVERSGIGKMIRDGPSRPCGSVIYHIDVNDDGHFSEPASHYVGDENKRKFWELMQRSRPENHRVRALFVENISGPVLQMLGTKYNIEPFFFSSSANWIPSRYQEAVKPSEGDHITITMTFVKAIQNPTTGPDTPAPSIAPMALKTNIWASTTTIDTQAPLVLRSNDKVLLLDILAIHMIRRPDSSTIISYHPTPEWLTTTAKLLHSRVRHAGESVYWKSIFQQSKDPTLVLLSTLWHALYAWDEALENLYDHICSLEARVLTTNDIHLTRELHRIRAFLLHYESLLEHFSKTVNFISHTPHPALQTNSEDASWAISPDLMKRESRNLLQEIERLQMARKMQDMRLDNVMNLAFSSVNFDDSQDMRRLTEAALRDSAAMKRISYLTMVFLPASFAASVFGMNIKEIEPESFGSLAQYLATAIPLTVVTIWVIMTFQSRVHDDTEGSIWNRVWRPAIVFNKQLRKFTARSPSRDMV